ncbi:ATP-binding cassette domain-containing protein [Rudanella paleaurantiibacter]|uniref:ATP-binding cassette domain-containing protein n=1 Tax=Rudanella paleaurantiibacter TaxID=2614655 RepID=A0A7J5TSZ1_9BACT|nr:ABC transporter ATP-binding protein [Rudanella paleaurantiibacter]KAB7726820.1 ATP-binding cassette domain-containing protein [Rudanella paleaurantiibacter]
MITVTKLEKSYGRLKVLQPLSATFQAEQAVSLIGPNGSGKTTFIKSILGLVVPDAGEISFLGEPIRGGWQYRRDIGYMPQIGRYPDNMKIRQVFAMMKDLRGTNQSPAQSNYLDEELIRAFGLPALFDKTMQSLSGGTRQKVSACLAFLFDPKVLILDEPTAGLDPLASEILKDKILKEKAKGKLILITSHVLSDLDELTTDVMYLQDGQLQFFKPVEWLQDITGEVKLGRAIASIMSNERKSERVNE